MKFYDRSLVPGFKRWMRALMWVKISKPLVPGCFFEYEEGKSLRVDFRYEGVFIFCKRCGKIGHTIIHCSAPWHHVHREINEDIVEASDLRIMYGREDAPLYSNKIKGLPNYDLYRTTRVDLYLPIRSDSMHFLEDNDNDDDDKGGDGDDEAGPSRRRRRCRRNALYNLSSGSSTSDKYSSSSDGDIDPLDKGKGVVRRAAIKEAREQDDR